MGLLEALIQLVPYAPLIVSTATVLFILRYYKTIRRLIKDIKGVYSELKENRCALRINPVMRDSFHSSKAKEPVLQVYRDFFPLAYRFDRKATEITIALEPDRALAIIPAPKSMDGVVNATHVYASEYLSQFSAVRDYRKLQKAMDVFIVLLVVRGSGLDGSLKTATERFVNHVRDDREMANLLDVLIDVNNMLKDRRANLDDRFTRILLIETCRAELYENGRLFA